MPTVQEYEDAKNLLADYKVCAGCHELFKTGDVTETVQYGRVKHWCVTCYPSVKNDW